MQRTIISPNMDVAKDVVLTVEGFSTEMKKITAMAVTQGWSREKMASEWQAVIEKYYRKIPRTLWQQAYDSITKMANADYYVLTQNIMSLNASLARFAPESIKALIADNPAAVVTQTSLRGFDIRDAKGKPMIRDYYQQVKEQMRVMASKPAVYSEVRNGTPRKMSIRNHAEMTVRYEAATEDLRRAREEGVKLMWTSSHEDASKRCAPWQGRLYSLDGTSGTKDGIPYSPLSEAEAGENGDGNGIITGYNCRHYLIEYQSGSNSPKEYSDKNIRKEYEITTKQRQYENTIRHSKLNREIALASGDRTEAQRLAKLIEKQTNDYISYSRSNGRPYYRWRAAVSDEESAEGEL